MIHSWQRSAPVPGVLFGLREPPVPAWGRSCPFLVYGGPQVPSAAGDQVPVKGWEGLREGLVLCSECCEFRSASDQLLRVVAAGLGGFPSWLHPWCAWDSAAVFFKCHSNESREGKSHFTGNSSQMQSSFSSEFCLLASLLQSDTWCLSLDQFVYRLLDYHLQ